MTSPDLTPLELQILNLLKTEGRHRHEFLTHTDVDTYQQLQPILQKLTDRGYITYHFYEDSMRFEITETGRQAIGGGSGQTQSFLAWMRPHPIN